MWMGMRETSRTLTCDRCGDSIQVPEFSYRGLSGATGLGWTKYQSAKAQKNFTNRFKDLCPECSRRMASTMAWKQRTDTQVILDALNDIKTLRDLKDIAEIRNALTKYLKAERAKEQI